MVKKKNSVTQADIEPVGDKAKPAEIAPQDGFPVVGIGASAGGLAAFEAFFSGMPKDIEPGMAFVLVQHLAPDHESILTALIQRYTRMQVFEVEDGMPVKPNCAYIIPPNRDMAFLNGTLQLLEPAAPRGKRLPIDFFFRSLAQDQHERAICIVLSGTGSDGTLGVRAIKGEGGMVMAQNPASTEYDGMPRSAIATGLVDFELPPAEMPAQLMVYVAQAFGKLAHIDPVLAPRVENSMNKIFVLLRAQTGHDFSLYKHSTIRRRIERRMAVQQLNTLENYIAYLQQTPDEVEALFHDLLIGVTSFFRDPEVFKHLEQQVIPRLFAGKPREATIRVWSAGCSTGEEAYSIAILLAEYQEVIKSNFLVQVFATDIDRQAVAVARAGLFPASISADISAERLARFFTSESGGGAYRIHKGIRDLVVFSEQDVIKDPPFSKMDMISCRNLMIYLGPDLQKKLIPLFHYALNPDGFLLLGTSETVGDFTDIFSPLDRKLRLFQRKNDYYGIPGLKRSSFVPPQTALDLALSKVITRTTFPPKLPLRELVEKALLQQVAPAAALVNADGDILYLHGRSGMFLELPPGETGDSNILKMAREGLGTGLTMALHKAARLKETVRQNGLRVKTNGDFSQVNLTVRPLSLEAADSIQAPLYLVILEEAPPPDFAADHQGQSKQVDDSSLKDLKDELRAKEEYLQNTNEELETSNEELKSSNEEIQSINEEMQSTNEELETSKEELQSVNEELATVNTELQTKITDLTRLNNDMNNLLAGTGIATIFLDQQFRILRFTPPASLIINLIMADVGRPVGHILTNLVGYDHLIEDSQSVLDTLIPKEIQVQTRDGQWYLLRIHPYRTIDNVIEGVVLTFAEISLLKRYEDERSQMESLSRLAVVVRDAFDAITVQDLEGRILAWNPGAVRMYGWSEAEALKLKVQDLIPEGQRQKALRLVRRLAQAIVLKPYHLQRLAKDGRIVEVWLTATALLNEGGQVYAIATTEKPYSSRLSLSKE